VALTRAQQVVVAAAVVELVVPPAAADLVVLPGRTRSRWRLVLAADDAANWALADRLAAVAARPGQTAARNALARLRRALAMPAAYWG
jgi:hypothetical protein